MQISTTTPPSEPGGLATFSYAYEHVPFKRYETQARASSLVYNVPDGAGGWTSVVVPPETSVTGSRDDAIRAARELSLAHRTVGAVVAVVRTADPRAWTLSPLTANFADGAGMSSWKSPSLVDARGLRGPFLGVGAASLTARGLRVEPLSAALVAVVDGAELLTF